MCTYMWEPRPHFQFLYGIVIVQFKVRSYYFTGVTLEGSRLFNKKSSFSNSDESDNNNNKEMSVSMGLICNQFIVTCLAGDGRG